MLAIYKKELRSYFTSMIGYVFISVFLLIVGIFFVVQNLMSQSANIAYTLSGITFVFVLLVPLLTMRIMSEENKQKTDQLLYTSPVTANGIVLGKFFAVLTIFGMVMLITCLFPLIMSLYGTIPMASGYSSIFGFLLLGTAYLSIGIFISSLTESQVVAAVVTYIVFLLTILMDSIASVVPTSNKATVLIFAVAVIAICGLLYVLMHNVIISVLVCILGEGALAAIYFTKPTLFDGSLARVLDWFSVIKRYDTFSLGTFNVAAVVYYLSVTFLFGFLTTQVIMKKRWS